MRTVDIEVLKNQLSKYTTYTKPGETITIGDRNAPVAQLTPFPPDHGPGAEERYSPRA